MYVSPTELFLLFTPLKLKINWHYSRMPLVMKGMMYTSFYHSNCPFAQTNTFVACGCQVFTDRTVKTVFSFSLRSQLTHVSDHDGLLEHADRSQLMPDLGGYLEYEHEDWVRFRMVSQLSIFLSACPPLCLSLSFTLSVCLFVCLIC